MRNANSPRSPILLFYKSSGPHLLSKTTETTGSSSSKSSMKGHRSVLGDKPHLANPHTSSLGDLVNRRPDGHAMIHLPDQAAADCVDELHAMSDVVLASDPRRRGGHRLWAGWRGAGRRHFPRLLAKYDCLMHDTYGNYAAA